MAIVFLFWGLFSPAITFAESVCDVSSPSLQEKNIDLEEFIQIQFENFSQSLDIPSNSCSDEQRKSSINLWNKLQEENYFNFENFLFSLSSLYQNTCRQKDVEKLIKQAEFFEKEIRRAVYKCQDPQNLMPIYNETLQMLQFIRDHNTQRENQKVTATGKQFKDYWKEGLYAFNSRFCPTESWDEVSEAWCKLKNDSSVLMKDFQLTEISSLFDVNNGTQEIQERKKKRMEIAQKEARKYLTASLSIPFLVLAPVETRESRARNFLGIRSFFQDMLQVFQGTFDLNSYPSSYTQDVFARKEAYIQEQIYLYDVYDLLADISDSYGKSYAAQLSLESDIYAFARDVESMRSKQEKRNMYDFIKHLKITENQYPNRCSVNIN